MSDPASVRPLPDFGRTPDGEIARCFELDNGRGVSAIFTTLGGAMLQLMTPDRAGKPGNVLLAPAGVEDILSPKSPFLGVIVGRFANRIDQGKFHVDGKPHQLTINSAPHTLHGGAHGYNRRVWQAEPLGGASVRLSLTDDSSADGFAGIVKVSVVYTITPAGAWRIEYEATTDAPTPINLTQHAYFNLKDAGRTDVLDHVLRIDATTYTPADAWLMPTGQVAPVAGTPLDFTKPKAIGRDLQKIDAKPRGYDHNFVLAVAPGPLKEIAEVVEPVTGRRMIVRTTEPGVQLYSGNFLDGSTVGPGGVQYGQYSGFCLETQHYPNSPNVPAFPNTILRPGQTFRSTTEYGFSAE